MPSRKGKKRPGNHTAAASKRAKLFRQNVSAEFKRLEWARSATKHRISRKRIRQVLENCLLILEEEPPAGEPVRNATRWVFLGEDLEKVPVEVIAVETDTRHLLVIHAMNLRFRYRGAFEEVRRCKR